MQLEDVVALVLVVSGLLAVVSLLAALADRWRLPLSLLLAVLGLAAGIGSFVVEPYLTSELATALVEALEPLDSGSQTLLYLFLPPLLFTAGLTVDVRLLQDEAAAVLLLAVVAVGVCTAGVGLGLWAVGAAPLLACLLLGSIVAATDPAAVLGAFRDLGAPRRLRTLVAGESLFNDAAAIALFGLFAAMLAAPGEPPSWGMVVGDFALSFLGGLAFGYLSARLFCWALPLLRDIAAAEVTAALTLAYLSFTLGEQVLGISGVVAVVTAALVVSVHGPARLRPDNWNTLHRVWDQIEFWANALIFVLASFVAGRSLAGFQIGEVGLLLLVVAAALAARALVLFGLLPSLTALNLTAPIPSPVKLLILWGGVRGAVTLVLALSITPLAGLSLPEKDLIVSLATGFVLFTLFVNATSLRPTLHLLKLDRLTPTERMLRDRALALSRVEVAEQTRRVAQDYGFDQGLVAACGVCDPALVAEPPLEQTALGPEERLKVALLTLANHERELYLAHFEDGTVSRRQVGELLASAERLIDRVRDGGRKGYDYALEEMARQPPSFRLALFLHRWLGWEGPLASRLADRYEGLLVRDLVVRELRRFNDGSLARMLGKEVANALSAILQHRQKVTADALASIALQYPGFAEALKLQYLQRAALRFESRAYRQILSESLVSREVYDNLRRGLLERNEAAVKRPHLDLGPGLLRLLQGVPILAALPEPYLAGLARQLRPFYALPGQTILKKGSPGRALYFLAAGEVTVILPHGTASLGAGTVFGEMALIFNQPRNADVIAKSYCHLMRLERRSYRRALKHHPELAERIRALAEERIARDRRS